MKKKYLITGGSGLLATNWALLNKNIDNISLITHKKKINIKNVKIIQISKLNKKSIYKLIKKSNIDYLVHTAAISNVDLCEKNKKKTYFVNTSMTKTIVDVCKKLKIKLIFISTDHLFKGNKSFSSELCKYSPLNIYASSKARAEKIIKSNLTNYLIIRTNFFGWGTSYRKSFSDWIYYSLKNNKKINLFDDVFFSPIYINDLIKAIKLLLKKKLTGTFNIVGNERLSKYRFGLLLAKVFNLNSNLIKKSSIKNTTMVRRPADMSLSNKKVKTFIKMKFCNTIIYIQNLKNEQKTIKYQILKNL